jgi:hypothetical protein
MSPYRDSRTAMLIRREQLIAEVKRLDIEIAEWDRGMPPHIATGSSKWELRRMRRAWAVIDSWGERRGPSRSVLSLLLDLACFAVRSLVWVSGHGKHGWLHDDRPKLQGYSARSRFTATHYASRPRVFPQPPPGRIVK